MAAESSAGRTHQLFCCARCLQMLGAQIDGPEQREFNGLQVDLWPRISWSPSFAISFADLKVQPSPVLPLHYCLGVYLSDSLFLPVITSRGHTLKHDLSCTPCQIHGAIHFIESIV